MPHHTVVVYQARQALHIYNDEQRQTKLVVCIKPIALLQEDSTKWQINIKMLSLCILQDNSAQLLLTCKQAKDAYYNEGTVHSHDSITDAN